MLCGGVCCVAVMTVVAYLVWGGDDGGVRRKLGRDGDGCAACVA